MPKNRSTGWETTGIGRNVVQAGVYNRPNLAHQDVMDTAGWITRAVVLQTYYPEEDDRITWLKDNQWNVLCDVRTFGRYSRRMSKVPVLQHTQGLHDQDIYIPRPSRIDTSGANLVTDPAENQKATAAEKLDGDHVLLGFLDNDPQQPVILPFTLGHPQTDKAAVSDGRIRRIRHAGVKIEWSEDGNLLIDATGAAKEELQADGSEDSNSGTGGQITLKTTDGTNQTSIHLDQNGQILLGSDPATAADEPFVCGNLWKTVMGQILDAIAAITVVIPSGSSAGTYPISNAGSFPPIKADINSGTQVSDFIFGKKAY
jgi:hypothetical protein